MAARNPPEYGRFNQEDSHILLLLSGIFNLFYGRLPYCGVIPLKGSIGRGNHRSAISRHLPVCHFYGPEYRKKEEVSQGISGVTCGMLHRHLQQRILLPPLCERIETGATLCHLSSLSSGSVLPGRLNDRYETGHTLHEPLMHGSWNLSQAVVTISCRLANPETDNLHHKGHHFMNQKQPHPYFS